LLYVQTSYLIYQGLWCPRATKEDNHVELMNEALILVQIYHIIWFSDFVNSPMFKYRAGWSACGIVLLQILLNVVRMAFKSIRQNIGDFRRWKYTKSELKRHRKSTKYVHYSDSAPHINAALPMICPTKLIKRQKEPTPQEHDDFSPIA